VTRVSKPWWEIQFRGWNNTSLAEIGVDTRSIHLHSEHFPLRVEQRRRSLVERTIDESLALFFSRGVRKRRAAVGDKFVWHGDGLSWTHHCHKAPFYPSLNQSYPIAKCHPFPSCFMAGFWRGNAPFPHTCWSTSWAACPWYPGRLHFIYIAVISAYLFGIWLWAYKGGLSINKGLSIGDLFQGMRVVKRGRSNLLLCQRLLQHLSRGDCSLASSISISLTLPLVRYHYIVPL